MRVLAICAPQRMTRSRASGRASRAAVRRHWRSSRQGTPFTSRRTGERKQRKNSINREVTISAEAVPRAAPATPSPAPGMVKAAPNRDTVRVGKINRLLNTTSRAHSRILSRLGVRISPLHWSILPAACRSRTKGSAQP